MVDTCVCIDIIRGRSMEQVRRLQSYRCQRLSLSTIVLAELEHRVAKSSQPDRNRAALALFLGVFEIIPFDDAVAICYGGIRAALERSGSVIGSNDMLIGAHAASRGAPLLTAKVREFKRVPGLRVEPWR